MNKTCKTILLYFFFSNDLWAASHCPPPHLSEMDMAKSVIEYSLSGGENASMQGGNICLIQDNFPYIKIEEVEEGELIVGDPEYLIQSKHNFTINSVKKIKRDLGWDYYKVVFSVDAIKEKKKVKLSIILNYTIDLNPRSDFSEGCLFGEISSGHLGAVYQECYDSVQSQYNQQEENSK